jgi:hypothetical protein
MNTFSTFSKTNIIEAKQSVVLDDVFIKTSGGCMRPLIKNGEVVCIVKKNRYCLGDVVLYEINSQKFLHRIIKVLPNKKYVVCDDTGITEPVEISFDNIIGFYPNVFNGVLGFVYYLNIKKFFYVARKIKNFIINVRMLFQNK